MIPDQIERKSRWATPSKLLRDYAGGSLMEFTIVFPLFFVVAMGVVDVCLMLSDWAQANKAAYVGAHRAIVSNSVAPGLTAFFNSNLVAGALGLRCWDPATGDPAVDPGTGNPVCATFAPVVCTSATCAPATVTTPSGSVVTVGHDSIAFSTIFDLMKGVFNRLQPTNVTITYERGANLNNTGHNEPNGFPFTVTVSITGMTHQFFFIGDLVRLFGVVLGSKTPGIPQFSSTLTGEDMCTDRTVCGL